jgi:hypothetical protein
MAKNVFRSVSGIFGRRKPVAVEREIEGTAKAVKLLNAGASLVVSEPLAAGDPDRYQTALSYSLTTGVIPVPTARVQSVRERKPSMHIVNSVKLMPELTDYSHEIVFFGEPAGEVNRFLAELQNVLRLHRKPIEVRSNHEAIALVLEGLVQSYFPGKTFWSPMDGVHELRWVLPRKSRGSAMVKLAQISGAPLEFGYPSRRKSTRANWTPLVRTHRANVLSVDEAGFTARHKRGVRRYSFRKLQWAVTEGHVDRPVEHELKLTLRIERYEASTATAILELDRVRSLGELRP